MSNKHTNTIVKKKPSDGRCFPYGDEYVASNLVTILAAFVMQESVIYCYSGILPTHLPQLLAMNFTVLKDCNHHNSSPKGSITNSPALCFPFQALSAQIQLGNIKRRERQLLPSSLGTLHVTSTIPFPLQQAETRQHKRHKDDKRHKDVAWYVLLGCSCWSWAGADQSE